MNLWVYTFISVTIISLISLVGVFFLVLKPENLRRIQLILVGLATGGLLGGAFIHLIPETFETFKNPQYASILLVVGFLLFFILERFLHWQHDHTAGISNGHIKPFGPINIIAGMFHNFLDGILIGAAFLYKPEIGITTTIIVILHEIPQEIGDLGILIHAGYTPRRALFYNFVSACSSYLGAFVVLIFSRAANILSIAVLPIAAGGFIYLAAADLIPELHTEKNLNNSIYQFCAILCGIGLLFLLLLLK